MKQVIHTLLLILCFSESKSQGVYDDHAIFPFAGISAWRYSYASVGVCYSGMTLEDNYPNSYNLFLATEIKLDKTLIVGPKAGCWITYNFFASGLSVIYYANSKNHSLVLRPEVGIEFKRFKFVYGYNLKLQRSILDGFNSHLIELTYLLRRQVFFTHKFH